MTATAPLGTLPLPAAPPAGGRLAYLDWLRGLAVLVMIEAHTLDAWTRAPDRQSFGYGVAMVIGGMGAPLFLFLAGIAVSLPTRRVPSWTARRPLKVFVPERTTTSPPCLVRPPSMHFATGGGDGP